MNKTEIDYANYPDSLHAALVAKRQNYENLVWQVPVLSLTAQAFLLTIAFGRDSKSLYVLFSGMMAFVIGLASWQLFLRHRQSELAASMELEKIELGKFGISIHTKPNDSSAIDGYSAAAMQSGPIWAGDYSY